MALPLGVWLGRHDQITSDAMSECHSHGSAPTRASTAP